MKLIKALCVVAFGFAAAAPSRAASPASAPADFEARLNGRPLELHDFPQGAFGLFEAAGAAEVEIRTGFDVRWVPVRPRSAGVPPAIGGDHHGVRFRAAGPVPLPVEFNGDLSRGVHLFPYAPGRGAPGPGTPHGRDFGPRAARGRPHRAGGRRDPV